MRHVLIMCQSNKSTTNRIPSSSSSSVKLKFYSHFRKPVTKEYIIYSLREPVTKRIYHYVKPAAKDYSPEFSKSFLTDFWYPSNRNFAWIMDIFAIISSIFLASFTLLILRIIYLLYVIYTSECILVNEGTTSFRTILCIGSGGHTTELLRLSKSLNASKYQPRLYIVANNDTGSEIKIREAEQGQKNYSIRTIPRSRNVRQTFKSAVMSTLHALYRTVPIMFCFKPNVILCNGPGTCIPICVVAFLLRCLFICNCRIVFVESVCRVRSLSLTGNILQYFADVFVVQWPQLRDVCFRAKYFGRLT